MDWTPQHRPSYQGVVDVVILNSYTILACHTNCISFLFFIMDDMKSSSNSFQVILRGCQQESQGVHCTKLVRIHVSAQEGY